MKLLLALFALVSFGLFVPEMHADPTLTVNAGALGGVLVGPTQLLNDETWVYTDAILQLNIIPPGLQVANQTVTFDFTEVAGVKVLNITDVCADVDVNLPQLGCSGLAFTFTDLGLGNPYLISDIGLLGAVGLDLNADVVGVNVGASIGGGSAQIGFGNPPAATPEPGTLSLMGTSLLGVAGVLRRKFRTA